jgi:hypothetical protein
VPDVAVRAGADSVQLGLVLLCLSLGALAAMQGAARLAARVGAGPLAGAAGLALSGAVLLPALATGVPALAVALGLFGAAMGLLNVAANALGVEVEGALGRPVLTTLHAGFSLGGLGGALAAGLVGPVLPVAVHLGLVGAAGVLTVLGVRRGLAADRTTAARTARRGGAVRTAPQRGRRPTGALVVLGAIAGCTAVAEGAVTDWGALYLRQDLGAAAVVASAAYGGFSLAMALGRLAGARLVLAHGERRVLAGGSLVAALGLLGVAGAGDVGMALAGFVLAGLGLATVFPLAVGRAGALDGARGVSLATTVGYTGLLGGPPVIGLLAGRVGLAAALGLVAALALLAALLVARVEGDAVVPAPVAAALGPRLAGATASAGAVVGSCRRAGGAYLRDLDLLVAA